MGMGDQPNASASLTPGKRPCTHYTGGCPMAGLEACWNSRLNRYLITGPYSP